MIMGFESELLDLLAFAFKAASIDMIITVEIWEWILSY